MGDAADDLYDAAMRQEDNAAEIAAMHKEMREEQRISIAERLTNIVNRRKTDERHRRHKAS